MKKYADLAFNLTLCLAVIIAVLTAHVPQAMGGGKATTTGTATATVVEDTPPVAQCRDITVELDATGIVIITADQIDNGSYDAWGPVTMTVSPREFNCSELGDNIVTLSVVDTSGNIATCTATVKVEDTTSPEISLDKPPPSISWPPNHKFVEVTITGTAYDVCDFDLNMNVSVSVIDTEGGDGGPKKGPKKDPDYQIVSATIDEDGKLNIVVALKVERSGKGRGRSYIITAEVIDDSGNSDSDTVEIVIPHERKPGLK